MHVRAVDADLTLGGDTFTGRLAQYCLQELPQITGADRRAKTSAATLHSVCPCSAHTLHCMLLEPRFSVLCTARIPLGSRSASMNVLSYAFLGFAPSVFRKPVVRSALYRECELVKVRRPASVSSCHCFCTSSLPFMHQSSVEGAVSFLCQLRVSRHVLWQNMLELLNTSSQSVCACGCRGHCRNARAAPATFCWGARRWCSWKSPGKYSRSCARRTSSASTDPWTGCASHLT